VRLKTVASAVRWLAPACLAAIVSACGGGQLAGSQASVQATTAAPAATAPPPATATAPPPAARPHRARGSRPRSSPPSAATTPRPTTTPPASATAPRTTPRTAAPHPASPHPARAKAPAGPKPHGIDEHASVTLVRAISVGHYIQSGRVTGTFNGSITVETKTTNAGIKVTFTVQVDRGGTVSGHGLVILNLTEGGTLHPIHGTADVTGGTGRFAQASGRKLLVTGRAALDGSRGTVRLTGVVTY